MKKVCKLVVMMIYAMIAFPILCLGWVVGGLVVIPFMAGFVHCENHIHIFMKKAEKK